MIHKTFNHYINQSHVGRIALLGILILLLQIPISSIRSLVYERQMTANEAVNEIQDKWGKEQRLVGPMLIIPYLKKIYWQDPVTHAKETRTETHHATFLPSGLEVTGTMINETRYRGIFEVPLYQTDIHLSGQFSKPDFKQWEVKDEEILWNKARLVMMVSDARAIQKQATININGRRQQFAPGTDDVTGNSEGYHVDLSGLDKWMDENSFSIDLKLNGSGGLYVAPLGKDSRIQLSAPWPDPSFQGKWLPTTRSVTEQGFDAEWQIPYLGRNYPQQTNDYTSTSERINSSLVGVNLIVPVDNYRMAERSIKYVMLFLFLTFLALWLIELLGTLRVHILQYFLIGAGLCLFYLLELSLSEHIGFYWAYGVATVAIVTLVSAYSLVVLHTGKRAAMIGVSLTLLYLYLFTLLQEQNYALLIGSLGLFCMLAAVMYLTRHVDWFKLTELPATKLESSEPA